MLPSPAGNCLFVNHIFTIAFDSYVNSKVKNILLTFSNGIAGGSFYIFECFETKAGLASKCLNLCKCGMWTGSVAASLAPVCWPHHYTSSQNIVDQSFISAHTNHMQWIRSYVYPKQNSALKTQIYINIYLQKLNLSRVW